LNYKGSDWKKEIQDSAAYLKSARPTAVNLAILIDEIIGKISSCSSVEAATAKALNEANRLKQREIEWSEAIGNNGCSIIERISQRKKGEVVNILTHCNAGWLACIDWGTATAPIYKAFYKGIPLHVWVDETRPRNQGARLTAWELAQEGLLEAIELPLPVMLPIKSVLISKLLLPPIIIFRSMLQCPHPLLTFR
jgi:methylthioribose-1-phosphate isomerase